MKKVMLSLLMASLVTGNLCAKHVPMSEERTELKLYSMEKAQDNILNQAKVVFKGFEVALNEIMKDSSLNPEDKATKIEKEIVAKSRTAEKNAINALDKEYEKQLLRAGQSAEIADYVHALQKDHKTDGFKNVITKLSNGLRDKTINALNHLKKQLEAKSAK